MFIIPSTKKNNHVLRDYFFFKYINLLIEHANGTCTVHIVSIVIFLIPKFL